MNRNKAILSESIAQYYLRNKYLILNATKPVNTQPFIINSTENSTASNASFVDTKSGCLLKLTPKQARYLQELLKGKSARELAEALHLSHRTVQHHIEEIRYRNNIESTKTLLLRVKQL
jgi:DNA-binding CsgD family transcriptional regulator